MPIKFALATAASAATAIAVIAGCSSRTAHNSEISTKSQMPPLSSVPIITTAAASALPIEAYSMTKDQERTFTTAENMLKISCMKRYGFDYQPYVAKDSGFAKASQTANRYGPVDPASTAQHGYHRGDLPQNTATRPPLTMSDAMLSILGSGGGPSVGPATPASYNGIAVPKGGCVGEDNEKLGTTGKNLGQHGLISEINFGGFTRSLTDTRVKTAFASWSECMKSSGYSYATPNDPLDDKKWSASPAPSPAEIATATADVTCKQKANVVGVWFTVESAYEVQMIEQHSQELTQIKQDIDAALRKADAVVGGA